MLYKSSFCVKLYSRNGKMMSFMHMLDFLVPLNLIFVFFISLI